MPALPAARGRGRRARGVRATEGATALEALMGAVSMAMPSCPVECQYVPTGAVGDARMSIVCRSPSCAAVRERAEARSARGKGEAGSSKNTFLFVFWVHTSHDMSLDSLVTLTERPRD